MSFKFTVRFEPNRKERKKWGVYIDNDLFNLYLTKRKAEEAVTYYTKAQSIAQEIEDYAKSQAQRWLEKADFSELKTELQCFLKQKIQKLQPLELKYLKAWSGRIVKIGIEVIYDCSDYKVDPSAIEPDAFLLKIIKVSF
jgi:hypothetical protein